MYIVYRDEGGLVRVEISSYEVQFLDGEAYFDDGAEEYRIKVENIVEIGRS